ncbi:hypothetical protein [Herbiconiux daphne]|uniref:Uncharacterized protein n=1 Tax=Herbiconiux daphne TaxID=2970914 RepID=A0ABT2H1V1_9MICO|nr:hypothetical protein [Herbiconiux daphne]MCS5733886.1 hypothetical protein [Herbiconiux daphne]
MRERTHDREFDSRFDAAFQPGFEESLQIDLDELASGGLERDVAGDAAPRRPRHLIDRFVVALWAVGAGLIVAGIYSLARTVVVYTTSNGADGPSPDYVASMVISQFAPWLFFVGVATIVGTLFLLAVRWERRA